MKKLLILIAIFLISTSSIQAHDEGNSVFGLSPSNFTLEKGQPGQSEIAESIVDNDLDADIPFDFKLTRLNKDESEVVVDLTGDILEIEFEGLTNGQFIAKANSETPLNFTMTITEDAPNGTFVYYLDLIEASEEPLLDGAIYMTFDIEIEDSTVAEVDGSFNLDINPTPFILGGCVAPLAVIGVVIVIVKRKKSKKDSEK